MTLTAVAQAVLLSLTVAGLYAAVAAGLTLTVGFTRIINFAHGEFVMLGAFLTYCLVYRSRSSTSQSCCGSPDY